LLKEKIPDLHQEVANMELIPGDTYYVSRTAAIWTGLELLNQGVVGIIGSAYSDMTQVIAAQTNFYQIPICDGSSTSPALSYKAEFPTFFRSVSSDTRQARAIVDFIENQGWSQFAIVAGQDAYGQAISALIRELAEQHSIKHLMTQNYFANAGDWKLVVSNLIDSGATIFLYIGQPGDFRLLLNEGRTRGIVGKGFAWITTDTMRSFDTTDWTEEETDNLNGLINVFPIEGRGPLYDAYIREWRVANGLSKNDTSGYLPEVFVLFFNDCLEMFVRGYDQILKSLDEDSIALLTDSAPGPKDLTGIVCPDNYCAPVFNFTMETPTGPLTMDEHGDRLSGYYLMFLNKSLGKERITEYYTSLDIGYQQFGTWDTAGIHLEADIILYSGGTTQKPPDSVIALLSPPTITFPNVAAIVIAIGSTLSILAILGSAIGIILLRNEKIIKSASPYFSLLILFGLLIAAIYPPVVIMDVPNTAKCVLEIWLIPNAFGIVMGNLLSKIYRVFVIFRDPLLSQSRGIRNQDVFKWSTGLLTIDLLISVIWTSVNPPRPQSVVVRGMNGALQLDTYCTSEWESVFTGIAFGYNALLLILGTLLAIGTRNLPNRFRESVSLSICIYNFFGIALFLLPTAYLSKLDPTSRAIIKSVGAYVAIIGTLIPLFFFKFYVIWMQRERKENARSSLARSPIRIRSNPQSKDNHSGHSGNSQGETSDHVVGQAKSQSNNSGDGNQPDLALNRSALGKAAGELSKIATFTGPVWVVERHMFVNLWSEKCLILLGDKKLALLVDGKNLSKPSRVFPLPYCELKPECRPEHGIFGFRFIGNLGGGPLHGVFLHEESANSIQKPESTSFLFRVANEGKMKEWMKALEPFMKVAADSSKGANGKTDRDKSSEMMGNRVKSAAMGNSLESL
ncbi:hypothetical protein HK102_004489, partial [Quaeritorhiza haematococci]